MTRAGRAEPEEWLDPAGSERSPGAGPEPDARWGVLALASAAQLVAVLGEHVFLLTALPLWAYDVTHSTRGIGLALAAVTAPALLSLPAGAWTSLRPTRRVLVGCAVLRLVLTLTLLFVSEAALRAPAGIAFVLAVAFGVSLVDSFFMPALKAALPGWVPRRDLLRANSILEASDIPAQLFGPPLGVFLYAGWGLRGAAAGQALVYLMALVMLARTPFPEQLGDPGTGSTRLGVRVRETLRSAWGSPVIRRTLLAWTAGMVAMGIAEVAVLPFITDELRQPESIFGLFGAVMGAGMVLGAIAASVWEPPVSDAGLLAAASAVVTLALGVFAAAHSVVLCAGALFFVGLGVVWVHVSANTLLQDGLPEAARAGALGLAHSIEAAGLLAGQAMGAALGTPWGSRGLLEAAVGFLALGAVTAAVTGWRQAARRRSGD